MDSFKVWILSLCGALVITSIFRILIHNSSVSKSINIFLSMFIFLYSIIPLEGLFNNFDFSPNIENETRPYDEYYKDGYERIVVEAINNVCEKNNVSVIEIDMDSYIDDNGYYCINKLEIEIDSPDKKELIISELKNTFGFEVTVY